MRRISSTNQQRCYNCWKIIPSKQQAQRNQCPSVNTTTDAITIEIHTTCKICANLFRSIKNYTDKYKLSYANHKFKMESIIDKSIIKLSGVLKQNISQDQIYQSPNKSAIKKQQKPVFNPSPVSNRDQSKNSHLGQSNSNKQQIYAIILQQTVMQNRLNYVFWLPKSIQYLIFLTSKNVRSEQRNQRMKKIIFFVSSVYSVQLKQLKILIMLLQTLICHMDQNTLMGIVDRLLKVYIRNQIPFQLLVSQGQNLMKTKQFDKMQQKQIKEKTQFQKLIRPDLVLYISLSVIILSDFIKQTKLIKQIKQVYEISSKSLSLNVSQKATQSQIQNYIKQHAQDGSKSSKINEQGWSQLLEVRKTKNNYILVLQTVKKEHQANLEYTSQIQLKFKKQKEEYINKIIKLNNKIEELETELEKYRQNQQLQLANRQKLLSEVKNLNMQKTNKSNPEVNQVINKQEIPVLINRINHSISTSNLEMQIQMQQKSFKTTTTKSMVAQTYEEQKSMSLMNNLQSILTITDIIQINKKYQKNKVVLANYQLPSNCDDLSSLIISQITKMEKNLMKLKNQGKKNKQQTNRIMSILRRKEQQWLPLFHEKDELISKYEDALLKLQNGKITQIQPLATRIKYIASKWNTCNKCAQNPLKNQRMSANEVQKNRNSFVNDKNSFLQSANNQKAKKKKDKECVIY